MQRRYSSDSDDDVPLGRYKARSSLRKSEPWPCEFCDHISSSRYDCMKHNATHIIIPLVKITSYQCETCLQHFTSLDELTTHAKVKNHKTSQVKLKSDYDIILQSIIRKQLVVKCHDLFNDIKENGRIRQIDSSVTKDIIVSQSTQVSKGTVIVDNVRVKAELPIVISDSDSNGKNSPLELGHSLKDEYRNVKQEVVQTTPEIETQTVLKNREVAENLLDGNTEEIAHHTDRIGEQTSLHLGKSETPLHEKWQQFDSDSEDEQKIEFYHSDEEITKVDTSLLQYIKTDESSPKRISSPDFEQIRSPNHEPIRSRLVFEDDLDNYLAEEILPDMHDRVPNMRLLTNTFKTNSVILGTQTNGFKVNNSDGVANDNSISSSNAVEELAEGYPESIHYDTLVRNEICDCRYCGRCFCNRMQLIAHEATHLRIRKPRPSLCAYCERFYAGNSRSLKKHVEARHPEKDPEKKRPQMQTCKTCNLHYYNLSRHMKYYHKVDKQETPQAIAEIAPYKQARYKTVKLCDMCLYWNKNTSIYKVIVQHSEVGKTQKCKKCHNMHFCINLVTRSYNYNKDGVRRMTNEERLLRITKKLKMIKQLNKCYLLFY